MPFEEMATITNASAFGENMERHCEMFGFFSRDPNDLQARGNTVMGTRVISATGVSRFRHSLAFPADS